MSSRQPLPFHYSVQGTADSDGNCTVYGGPTKSNEDWQIEHLECNNPGPRVPTIYLYKNYVGDGGFVDGTLNGLFAATDTPMSLLSSETFITNWTLCTPGTTCTVTVRGTRYVAF